MAGSSGPRPVRRARAVARSTLGRAARFGARRLGYDLVPVSSTEPGPGVHTDGLPPDFDSETAATVAAVQGYTVTSPERVQALCAATRYVVEAKIPGAIVECGVWRGGSALAVVRTLRALSADDTDVYLFDTFDKFPNPGSEDYDLFGTHASRYHDLMEELRPLGKAWDDFPVSQTRALLESTGFPPARLHFVEGLVEDTVPTQAPPVISLLRLDTDYYQSTKHELVHLFPRIPTGGVLIIDDYGHFTGCRQATDEYLAELRSKGVHLLLQRIDYSGRLALKPPAAT